MPEGSFFFSVIIIDENGLSSNVVTNTYTLKKVDKFDSSAAEQLIWSTLIKNKVINDNHKTEEDGLFEMTYNSKKSINGKSIWLFSVSIDDEALMSEDKLAIILGTEGDGLCQETIDACDYTVKIPMAHGVDSLNVAAASAVAFWQLAKRK